MSTPIENSKRLMAIAKLNPASRINIDKAMAIEIADQLVGLKAELDKTFKQLCEAEINWQKERMKNAKDHRA